MFGLADAPREWYKRLVRELESLGWSKGCVDEAVFLKWEAGKLTGVLIAHVDDMVMAGSLSAKKSLEELGNSLELIGQLCLLWQKDSTTALRRSCLDREGVPRKPKDSSGAPQPES